jgi:pilus assembly protein CpaF
MSFELILPFLQPIESLLLNPTISEIMVNPDSSIWMEAAGQKQLLNGVRFEQGTLETALEVIANKFGKRLNADSPILNLRLPDGSRLAAVIPPIVNPAPLLTIRKFTSRNFGIQDLVDRKMLTGVQADQLAAAIRRGDNILIAGGTGTGKQVTQAARALQLTSNALLTSTKPKDRDGICHQLANEDRLRWTKS